MMNEISHMPESGRAGQSLEQGRAWGRLESFQVRDGFSLVWRDVIYRHDGVVGHTEKDSLKLHCKLSGDCGISDGRADFTPVEAGRLSVLAQPFDSIKLEKARVDSRERSVTMICSRQFAESMLTDSPECLPDGVADFIRGRDTGFSLISTSIPFRMRMVVEEILDPPCAGALRSMILEAKALELLFLSLHQLQSDAFIRQSVKAKDARKVKELCALLEEQPSAKWSIAQLCQMTAWNESQMMESFKLVTGTTVQGYRRNLFMKEALRQLSDTDTSIMEIAFEAGYDHPQNFATAFKRKFGITPKEARSGIAS